MAVASAGADCLQAPPEPVFRILKPGRNCWRVEPARHVAVLTNGEYFRVLAAALAQAEQEIILIGWDLDARIVLDPENDRPAGPAPGPIFDPPPARACNGSRRPATSCRCRSAGVRAGRSWRARISPTFQWRSRAPGRARRARRCAKSRR